MKNRRGNLRGCGWLALAALALLAVWVMNVSRPGTRVEGCAWGCATTGPRREGPLRIMSLNVLHGFPRFAHLEQRLDRVAGAIQETDADIVCLQEVPWHWGSLAGRLADQTGLNYLYLRANGNRWTLLFEEGEAILSRYPLDDAAFIELEPRAGPFEHRVVLRATATTPSGHLQVFCTHLTHGEQEVNAGQAASLAEFVASSGEGPAVVAGDLDHPKRPPVRRAVPDQLIDRAADLILVQKGDLRQRRECVIRMDIDPRLLKTPPVEARVDFGVPQQGAQFRSLQLTQ